LRMDDAQAPQRASDVFDYYSEILIDGEKRRRQAAAMQGGCGTTEALSTSDVLDHPLGLLPRNSGEVASLTSVQTIEPTSTRPSTIMSDADEDDVDQVPSKPAVEPEVTQPGQALPPVSDADQTFLQEPSFVPPPLPSGIFTSPPPPDYDYVRLAESFQQSVGLRPGSHSYAAKLAHGDIGRYVGMAEVILAGGDEAQRLAQAQCVGHALLAVAHKALSMNAPDRYDPVLAATLTQQATDAREKAMDIEEVCDLLYSAAAELQRPVRRSIKRARYEDAEEGPSKRKHQGRRSAPRKDENDQ
jgi:hypothetical protein